MSNLPFTFSNPKVEAVVSFLIKHLAFWACLGLFILLLARNPFSERTLIATFDPFPDSIHYTNPGFNILAGKGYVLEREGRTARVAVPPLYPVALVPFFAIFNDVRAYYFANVILALIAYILFYRLVNYSFSHPIVKFIVLFLYVSCLTLSWYPTLAMAENLILPLFLGALNLMLGKISFKKSCLMAVLIVGFYATKYASVPLSASFSLLYLIKVWLSSKTNQERFKHLLPFFVTLAIVGASYEFFEFLVKGKNVITQVAVLFVRVFITRPTETSTADATTYVFFSTDYIWQNIHGYGWWLLGNTLVVLWRPVTILPAIMAIPALVGLGLALTQPKWRYLASSLLLTIVATLAFMMTFYTTDGRYFFTAIPTLFLGFGFALSLLVDFLLKKTSQGVPLALTGLLVLALFAQNLFPLKSAVMLNLKYAETPWPYLAILRLNAVVDAELQRNPNQPKPVVITALNPYYVDFFSNKKITLIPLSSTQESRDNQTEIWGEYDLKNLPGVYKNFIDNQTTVYFINYGINDALSEGRDQLYANFSLELVDSGCQNSCNIYKLHLK